MIIDRCDSLSYLYNQSRFLHSLPCKNSRTNRYYWYKKRSRCKDRCLAHTHQHLKIKMCKFTSKYVNSLLQFSKNEIKQFANRLERQYPNSSDSSFSMRKQPTCFPGKWRQRNARTNSILMTCITQIWIVLLSLEGDFSGVGSDRSSVWNFCACSLDVISRKSEVVSRDVDCFHRLQQSSRSSFPKAKF